MAVRRTGNSSYWSFSENIGYTRLYRDDVGALVAVIEEAGATARIISGQDVTLESSEDIPSLTPDELHSLTIETASPRFTIALHQSGARVYSYDSSEDSVAAFGSRMVRFLKQHRATLWERVAIDIYRAKKPLMVLTLLALLAETAAVVWVNVSQFYLLGTLGPLIAFAIISALASSGTGTWISRATRADGIQSREKRIWQALSYIGTTIVGAIVGYVAGQLGS